MKKRAAIIAFFSALILTLSALVYPARSSAQTDELNRPTGDEIAQRINARNEGEAVSRTLTMELMDRTGKKRVLVTRGFRKYYGEEKHTVVFYESPKNVKGTAFLTYDYAEANGDDDQWLYLPALRKVLRISASDRGDYFLGTDFTYDDIKKETKVGIEDYTWKTIGEEKVDGHRTFKVETTPVNQKVAKELGYGRVVRWVDAEIWIVRKSEFWDVRGNPLKTIHTKDIRKVQGIWTAHQFEAENQKTGHKTILTLSDVDYESKVADDIFTERALRRGI